MTDLPSVVGPLFLLIQTPFEGPQDPVSLHGFHLLGHDNLIHDSFIPVAQRIWNLLEIRLIPMDFQPFLIT